MKKYEALLLLFASLVALSLHFPLIPHEAGNDSFFIHRAADSIIYYHQIKWLASPFSLAGYYPYSYPSAIPTLLAETSYITGIPMEYTILLFTWIEGLLAVFFSFYLGRKIIPWRYGKWILVFVTAFSPGFLYFSLWTVSTRGFMSVIFILLIYLLFETRNFKNSKKAKKFTALFLIFFLISPTIHRSWVFLIPFILVFIIFRVLSQRVNIKNPKIYYLTPIILLFLILASLQLMMSFYTEIWKYFNIYNINAPSTYYILGLLYGRLNGPLIFLLPLGIYYIFKHKNEWNLYFLLFIILILPFYFIGTYTSVISYVVFPIIISYGILGLIRANIKNAKIQTKKSLTLRKAITIAAISLVVINIIFAGAVQYYHPNLAGQKRFEKFYMDEHTYDAGIWLKYSWHPNIRDTMIINYGPNRIFAISQDKTIADRGLFELVNNFASITSKDVKINPKFWTWPDIGPFVLKRPYVTPYSYWYPLVYHTPTDKWSKNMQRKFDISIVVENKNIGPYQQWSPYIGVHLKQSKFYENISKISYTIYENDKYEIYYWG